MLLVLEELDDEVNPYELELLELELSIELELELDELYQAFAQSGGPFGYLPKTSSCTVHSNDDPPVG